jgi:colanic acid/amylovoran biosynthesis protein
MTASEEDSILVVNCWDDSNKGDAAITIGVLNTLTRNYVADRLRISSYVCHSNDEELQEAFRHVRKSHPDTDLVPCYFPALSRSIGKVSAFARACRCAFKLAFPRLMPDTLLDNAVRRARAVVSNGGLYFGFRPVSTVNMLYHLFAFSYPMLLAKRLRVPYVLFGQSFGPFPSRLSKLWMRVLVNLSDGTWCRESLSASTLKSLGADDSRIKVIPDAAFGISAEDNVQLSQIPIAGLRSEQYIAISLRSLVPSGFSASTERTYLQAFLELIEWIVSEKELTVVLVAHTQGPVEDEDDRITTRMVYERLSSHVISNVVCCELDLSPQELCTLYGNARLVIATRFHAVVLSLCGGAPVLAIPYFGMKTQGALRDMGLASSVLEVGQIDALVLRERVASKLERAVESRSEILHIGKRLYQDAMQSGAMLKQVAQPRSITAPVAVESVNL